MKNIENHQLYQRCLVSHSHLNLNQASRLHWSSSSDSFPVREDCGIQNAGGGNQTFQWEYLGLIDSITWSTNLEIGTPICLCWQINLFPVSEEKLNEFQKPCTRQTNVWNISIHICIQCNEWEFYFSMRSLLFVYHSVHAVWANYTGTKIPVVGQNICMCVLVQDSELIQYSNSSPTCTCLMTSRLCNKNKENMLQYFKRWIFY